MSQKSKAKNQGPKKQNAKQFQKALDSSIDKIERRLGITSHGFGESGESFPPANEIKQTFAPDLKGSSVENQGSPFYPTSYSIDSVIGLDKLRKEYEGSNSKNARNKIIDIACEQLKYLIESSGEWVIQALFCRLAGNDDLSISEDWTASNPKQFRQILSGMLCQFPTILPQPILEALLNELGGFELGSKGNNLSPENVKMHLNATGTTLEGKSLEIRASQHVLFRTLLALNKSGKEGTWKTKVGKGTKVDVGAIEQHVSNAYG